MDKPPWICRTDEERKRFGAWTNEQLDLMDEPSLEDLEREANEHFLASTEKNFGQMLIRGRITEAIERKDHEAIARLTAEDPDLRRLAFQLLTRMRGPGRRKGELRAPDLPEAYRADPDASKADRSNIYSLYRERLKSASADVDRIRHIWKINYKRSSRKHSPTADEIAARRNDVELKSLINFRKG
jgi:hypothetical protein